MGQDQIHTVAALLLAVVGPDGFAFAGAGAIRERPAIGRLLRPQSPVEGL
jgi:hypothetical protein